MWECGLCRKRLFNSSGVHRSIRTASGHHRLAGLCPACAACEENRETSRGLWKTLLLFSTVAVSAAVAALFVVMPR
jgi:hypothetical protein